MFVLLLLAECGRQRREIDRLTEERAVLVEGNRDLAAERDKLRQHNEELSRVWGWTPRTRRSRRRETA